MPGKTLRLVLGDQLNYNHSWWKETSENVTILFVESKEETGYVRHHIQKIIAFFLSMRAFAENLVSRGFEVVYIRIDDERNMGSIPQNIKSILSLGDYTKFEYQLPDEYRLDKDLKELCDELSVATQVYDTEHFLTERSDLAEHFKGKKTYIMESFYRMMRKKYDILMDGSNPAGGKWNFDKENRKSLPEGQSLPEPLTFKKEDRRSFFRYSRSGNTIHR